VFTGSSPDVYLQVKDIVSNQAAFSATAPGAPQSYQLKDVSNVAAGDFKEFIFWQVYSSGAGTTFASYKLQRSADAGASYSTISTITDQDLNYYLDSTVNGSTTYTYRVQTTDSDGDTSAFTPAVSDLPNGQGGTDVTAPVITSVTVSETQSTWVTLTWTTDELSNSIVQYSADPDTSFGTAVTVNTMVTSHSVTITGLTPNTLYHMRVRSADILNNAATDANGGGGYSVTTTNGPIISNVTTPAIGDQTASVSWDTNIDSSSIVVYADNAALSNPQQAGTSGLVGGASSTVVFQHRVDLTGLTAGRTYYYYVQSTDADSNATTDNNSGNYYTFHTSQDVNGPTISNVSTPIVGSVAAVIVWQTSELSTSQVAYGNSSTSLSSLTTLDSTLSIYHIATITGLTEQTEYFFAVHSKDQADNETVAEVSSFTTAQSTDVLIAAALSASTGGGGGGSYYLTDTTPPSITELAVKDIGPFDATVTWRTNKLVRSFVELTDGKGNVTTFGSANPSEKTSIHLTNLKLGQMYSYVAKSVDTSGNFSAATPSTFQTTFVVEQNDETQISDVTDLQDKLSDVIESSLPSLLPPTISDIAISDITESSAKITWNTNIKGSSLVAIADKGQYHPDTDKPYPLEQSGQEEALKSHTVTVQDLEPNTLYHYQVRTKTLVGTLGKGPDKTFSTKAGKIKPFISGLTSTSFIVSWTTDQPTTSVVEYKNKATGAVNRKSDNTMTTKHEVTIANISQGASYEVTASGANSDGNILSGESLPVTVTRDVSAPVLSNFKVESFMVPGRADRIQTVVSWQTNEPADSVVEYNEGVGNSKKGFENRYEDLKDLTVTHTVALLNLKPETVYELQVTSADQFGNKTVFGPRTVITPKQAQSIIDVIFSNFNETFKFIKNINP
jgi:phosphodiesterase/alkaline phosphatase D-like protein